MLFTWYKTFKDGRYAYIKTESSHLNGIQVTFVKFCFLSENIILGWEPCLCDVICVASPGRDRSATVIPTPTLFYMSSKKTGVDRTFMVAVLKRWSKLPAIPSVNRGKFSPYEWGLVFSFYFPSTYVFFFTSPKNIVCGTII